MTRPLSETVAAVTSATASRMAGVAAFIALLAGLPVAVEFTDGSEAGWAALHARTSDAIALTTPIRVSDNLALTVDSGLVSLSGRSAPANDGPRMVMIEEGHLTLDLAQAPPGTPTVGPESPVFTIPNIAGFAAGALRLRRATFTIIGPSRERVSIRDVNATVTANRKGSHKLVGTGHFNGQRLSFDAIWSDAASRNGTPQMPLRLSLRTAFVEAMIDGLVSGSQRPTFEGQGEFRLPSLRRFISWSGLGSGVTDHMQAFRISGPLNWTTARMAFSRAVIDIDGNQGTGALTINHGAKRLAIDGTLAFEQLDLGRYWLSRPQVEPAASTPAGAARPFLGMFDADLRLSAAKIRTPALQIGRGAATIALTDGRLQADFAGIEIEDGMAEGQLKLDVNPSVPEARFKVKIKGVDAGRLLTASMKPNALLGRTNLTLDGTAQGRSLIEALATLAGRGQFDLTEPGRLGLDLPALIYAARGSSVVGWTSAGKGSTALDTLTGRFRLLNGALSLETVQARTGPTTFFAGGRLDVPGRLMDVTIGSGPGAQGEAPVTAHDVLVLRGNWDNPAISLVKPDKPSAKADLPERGH